MASGGNAAIDGFGQPYRDAGWDTMQAVVCKQFGEEWRLQKRSAVLIMPSIVARLDSNILINPAHPEYSAIGVSLHQPSAAIRVCSAFDCSAAGFGGS